MVKIFKYNNLISTNKFALENIDNYETDCVIQANTQSSGRGRFNRKWISDKLNNCYISFVLKPDINYKKNFPNLTQYLSVILCDELTKYNVAANIKWPNDIQINGKKIAGILSEISFCRNKLRGIILGVGVNLNLDISDLCKIDIPATALNLEINSSIDSDIFINNLAERFFNHYQDFLEKGFVSIKDKYISYTNFLGKTVSIKNPDPIDLGIAINVCNDGALEILSEDNITKKIYSGDVNII